MSLTQLRRLFPAVLSAAVVTVAVSACGSSDSSTTASTTATAGAVAKDDAAAALVPAKFQGKTLVVASDASYAPMEFIGSDNKTVVGADADLADAIGKTLGLETSVQNATFDSILAGIKAGKYELGMSSFTDNKEREATVDFVTYLRAGSSFYTPAGKATVKTREDLCGMTVAVEKGTVQQDEAEAQAKLCPSGKSLTLLTFPEQNAVNLALNSGRAQVGIADTPVAAYAVKKSAGKLELSGDSYNSAPYGIAMPKGSGLDKPVQAAVKALIASGTYQKILDKWGVGAGAITEPKVNGAES